VIFNAPLASRPNDDAIIELIGPGGAGKSTIGALLAERPDVTFLDLDRHVVGRVGDIREYIGRHGYNCIAIAASAMPSGETAGPNTVHTTKYPVPTSAV
jgi:hypothetical protein